MRLVWGVVDAVVEERDGVQRCAVTTDEGRAGRAVNYVRLAGPLIAGDRVLLNTTAVELTLGTGGTHFVVARAGEGVALDVPSGGHVMKLRYTPVQIDVMSVEAQESPYHDIMAHATSLEGIPVVCCGLHSQIPLVAAALKLKAPEARVAYCMTDGAALLLELSDSIKECLDAGLLDATVTCGQATGGQYEAVNLHSGMLAARHIARADAIVVGIGPGVVGTGTPFGHGGVALGEALNAVAALDGLPVACLRVSHADQRDRHRGVSHHSITALTSIATSPVEVALPRVETQIFDAIDGQLLQAGVWARHTRAVAAVDEDVTAALRGVRVSSMGRTFADDPVFFQAAFAAGIIAFSHL